jgi:hypothetical protein
MLSLNISYSDLMKFPYFFLAITTQFHRIRQAIGMIDATIFWFMCYKLIVHYKLSVDLSLKLLIFLILSSFEPVCMSR